MKHELINGAVFAMTGASRWHSIIANNLGAIFNRHFRKRKCEVYCGDIRVQVNKESTYTYPDVVVVCGEPKFRTDVKPDTLENPLLIFEILSPSTELIDRNRKLDQYLEMESLASYFLVSQDKPRVEAYLRHDDGWLYSDWSSLDVTMDMPAVDCKLALDEVFNKVDFRLQQE